MTVYHVRRADVSGQRQRGRSRRGLPGISPTRAWFASSGANFPHDGTRLPPLGARVASSRGRTFVGAPPPRGTPRSGRAYWSFQWTLWTLVHTLRERAWAVHWGKLTFFHILEERRHKTFWISKVNVLSVFYIKMFFFCFCCHCFEGSKIGRLLSCKPDFHEQVREEIMPDDREGAAFYNSPHYSHRYQGLFRILSYSYSSVL